MFIFPKWGIKNLAFKGELTFEYFMMSSIWSNEITSILKPFVDYENMALIEQHYKNCKNSLSNNNVNIV